MLDTLQLPAELQVVTERVPLAPQAVAEQVPVAHVAPWLEQALHEPQLLQSDEHVLV